MEERICYIYGLRPLNSKFYFYIGSTTQPVEERIQKHYAKAVKGQHENQQLAELLIKEKFQVDTITECDVQFRDETEYTLIELYRNEYNHPLVNKITNKKVVKRNA